MNGAQALLGTLAHNGVEVCFANPGTSEMHAVAALEDTPRIRGSLVLFEGVATGAADGYGRMSGRPAATLLHLGPGLANGLSNLHNARRACSPVVNVIGDHASYHRALDAPLTSDVEGAARPFSDWVRTTAGADAVVGDGAAAVAASLRGQIASLVLPADTAWSPLRDVPPQWPVADPPPAPVVDEVAVTEAARLLRDAGPRAAILFGGRTSNEVALELAARIAAPTGAEVLVNTHIARVPRGAGRHPARKVPYPVEQARELFDRFDTVVLVGAAPPVAFFAYPDKRSRLTRPGTRFVELCDARANPEPALRALLDTAGQTGAAGPAARPAGLALPARPTGTITPDKLAAFLANVIPEDGIVVDESITTGRSFHATTATARPHDWLSGTGGSIGYAMPVAVGAAMACPGRRVLTLESDGSGLYMPQALWTQAREGLDVVTLVFANRRYQILRNEMANVGVQDVGERAAALLDLTSPVVDWVQLARGLGVQATRAETMDELGAATDAAMAAGGPTVIEVVL
jgi:acetolactate synthase-1/2/3 large subunit